MKLVVGGSTGFVVGGTYPSSSLMSSYHVYCCPRPAREPSSTELRLVICDNFESYADSVKRELEDTDACIWYTPMTHAFVTLHVSEHLFYHV